MQDNEYPFNIPIEDHSEFHTDADIVIASALKIFNIPYPHNPLTRELLHNALSMFHTYNGVLDADVAMMCVLTSMLNDKLPHFFGQECVLKFMFDGVEHEFVDEECSGDPDKHNHMSKLKRMYEAGYVSPTMQISVHHSIECGITVGGYCDCDPHIEVMKDAIPTWS